ncbi:hypothetical protein [Actinopolymorpha pittospori]|uniref:Uncharacterized protein n=1 Tax=Actinopolymorpha pittospori TaxID=648752 RepID=A0A927N010_9ACTN|nr:hypothetical protein [Actinopolymorpha pittospori]MBE1610116.1 hypothetical protein [Actinopolymorpha pittospori]
MRTLTADDLLAGTSVVHDVELPQRLLDPLSGKDLPAGVVRLRPLTVQTLVLVSRAARDDPGLVPVLMVKEALVEPRLSLEQVRALSIGLLHFLVAAVNTASGLAADGEVLDGPMSSPMADVHVLLATHFGWSPDQVAQLTPGQVAVYLAGVERLQEQTAGAR